MWQKQKTKVDLIISVTLDDFRSFIDKRKKPMKNSRRETEEVLCVFTESLCEIPPNFSFFKAQLHHLFMFWNSCCVCCVKVSLPSAKNCRNFLWMKLNNFSQQWKPGVGGPDSLTMWKSESSENKEISSCSNSSLTLAPLWNLSPRLIDYSQRSLMDELIGRQNQNQMTLQWKINWTRL